MAVRGFVAVAVVDHYGLALRRVALRRVAHHAVGRGEDARTLGDGVIHALMRLQRLVEGVDAHAVGGCEQRQLLVDHGLDRGDVVAPAARRVDARLQFEVRGVERFELSFHFAHPLAQFAFELTRRAAHDLFVGRTLPLFVLRVEIVRLRLEEDAENVAVAFRKVSQNGRERVVPGGQRLVFAAQAVGRVLHLVFERRVEEDREAHVVEHRHPQPHEKVDRGADDPLLAPPAPAQTL